MELSLPANQPIQNELVQSSLFPGLEQKPALGNGARSNSLLASMLALLSIKGLGTRTLAALYDLGIIETVWQLDKDAVEAISLQIFKYNSQGTSKDFARSIIDNGNQLLDYGEKEASQLIQRGVSLISSGSSAYPKAMLRLHEPPRWLFVQGSIEALSQSSIIAIVGTRQPSVDGRKLARRCANELALRNLVVLSGLAQGIDESAHWGALDAYGQSVGVLGHGFFAPNINQDSELIRRLIHSDGAVVSEYFPFEPPSRQRFLRRNELIAALAAALIPVECPDLQSGTGATIRRAMKLGTPILGVTPSRIESESLSATKENLIGLGVSVYTVMNGNSRDFWDRLRNVYPLHDWSAKPERRQDRFFRNIVEEVNRNVRQLNLDPYAIDRLTDSIKRRIFNDQPLDGDAP